MTDEIEHGGESMDNLKHSAKLAFIQSADRVTDHLEHHGIAGQRWGHRNGPPYPLNATGKEKFKEGLKKAGASVSKGAAAAVKKTTRTTSRVAAYGKQKIQNKYEKYKEKKREEKLRKATNSNNKKALAKAIKDMPDSELKEKLNRIKLENQYRDELSKTPEAKALAKKKEFKQKLGKMAMDVMLEAGKEKVKQAMGLKNQYDEQAHKKAELQVKKDAITVAKETKRATKFATNLDAITRALDAKAKRDREARQELSDNDVELKKEKKDKK